MATAVTLTGAQINLYVNEVLYKEVDSVSFNVETVIDEISGIDSSYIQELAPNSVRVRGTINGMRISMSGGLQGKSAKPLYTDILSSPYISIRLESRTTQEQLFSCFNAMVSNESHNIPAKGIYRLSFNFVGIIGLFPLDRS